MGSPELSDVAEEIAHLAVGCGLPATNEVVKLLLAARDSAMGQLNEQDLDRFKAARERPVLAEGTGTIIDCSFKEMWNVGGWENANVDAT